MGPILFIAFTTDLAQEVTNCKFVAYADDAALLVSAASLNELKIKIESSVGAVQKWYSSNGLQINSEKTEFMVFKQRDDLSINISNGQNQVTIVSKKCLKILGMKVDAQLTFRNHVALIKSRASNSIRNIARSNNILSLSSRIILTNALVVPHYNYGDVIYDGCTSDAKLNLERSQNYAAKALLGYSKYSSATNALQELKWIPLEQRRKVHQSVFVHKALQLHSSNHAFTTIRSLLPQHKHSTRMKTDLKLNSRQHSTSRSERSTISKSILAWNSIPKEVRRIESTKNFKDKLQKYYIDEFVKDRNHVGTSI